MIIRNILASSFLLQSLQQHFSQSSFVVRVEVLSKRIENQPDALGMVRPYQFVQLRVLDQMKGEALPEDVITVRALYNDKNPNAVFIEGLSDFFEKEDLVLFLGMPVEGVYPLRSMSYAKYPVVVSDSGDPSIVDPLTHALTPIQHLEKTPFLSPEMEKKTPAPQQVQKEVLTESRPFFLEGFYKKEAVIGWSLLFLGGVVVLWWILKKKW